MYTREQINALISEQNRVKSAISAHKRESRSPMDVFEQFVVEILDKRAEALKKDILEALREATPIKGMHYFDGEKGDTGASGKDSVIPGPKGEKGDRGIDGLNGKDGQDGKDGKNISPKEARIILKELLADFKTITEEDVENMLTIYEKKSGKTLEKRLNALQDAVMRNYGGHGGHGSSVNTIFNEVVSGSGTTFTLAHTPTLATQVIYALGQRLTPATDYTISGAVITTVSSWLAGQILADYQY